MTPDSHRSAAHRALPILLFLFVGSGCAALIYEIVWFQLLQLVIGSSAISLAVLLGTFMGGMCLGSLLLPKYVNAKQHPLKVYAFLELGIGVCGLFVLFGAPLIGGWYDALGLQGMPGIFGRAIVAGICLLPPTLMMGATLPAMSRWVETTPSGVSWLGYFYGGNIAGAVLGSLLAGFYLLRMFDMTTATIVALLLNILVAAWRPTPMCNSRSTATSASPSTSASAASNSALSQAWPLTGPVVARSAWCSTQRRASSSSPSAMNASARMSSPSKNVRSNGSNCARVSSAPAGSPRRTWQAADNCVAETVRTVR